MKIGELADAVGLPTRTLRFYERVGLLPVPDRAANGYRTYRAEAATRVLFIRRSQAAGLTLAEIRGILTICDSGTPPCSHVGELLNAKLDEIRERRAELETLEVEIRRLLDRSDGLDPSTCDPASVCQILA